MGMSDFHLWYTEVKQRFDKRTNTTLESFIDINGSEFANLYMKGYSVGQAVSYLCTSIDEKYDIRPTDSE